MVDTVNALATRFHDVLVTLLTQGSGPGRAAATPALHDIVARAGALGPDGAWLVASGHASLGGLALAHGEGDLCTAHLDAAVTAGFNDCVALHSPPLRPLHHDPRFRALYERMRITRADLDEFFWLHQEMQTMSREAQQATVDHIGRLDTGVSLLPQVPLPTRRPHTPGVLATRVEFAALQTALHRAVAKAEFQRSAGNTSLGLIDDTWDYAQARRDAWHAEELDSRRRREAEARAYVERPGTDTTLTPCPPLGSLTYPA
ncbi:hypothetical protein [Streptomyces sp. WAC06614]|uniref:hypothetical protein n=1 Tax=Streptomyces sp. WAC06614 TaxID=2487416 RepID=UPI000F7727A9|nr:hypothetical protein [Streptomyces sp. WAC06614]RSS82167.1 hypothetical protein EF918_07780 [Streptomyces sp. WAC06614]